MPWFVSTKFHNDQAKETSLLGWFQRWDRMNCWWLAYRSMKSSFSFASTFLRKQADIYHQAQDFPIFFTIQNTTARWLFFWGNQTSCFCRFHQPISVSWTIEDIHLSWIYLFLWILQAKSLIIPTLMAHILEK